MWLKNGIVAVDPGVNAIATCVKLGGADHLKTLSFPVTHYRDASRMDWAQRKTGSKSRHHRERYKDIINVRKRAPSEVSVLQYDEYVAGLAKVWTDWWKLKGRRYVRKVALRVQTEKRSTLDKYVNQIKALAKGAPVVWGDGGKGGSFNRIKGCRKGPMLEFKRMVKNACVRARDRGPDQSFEETSEFRTSMCCLHCGRKVKNRDYTTVYCTFNTCANKGHMGNRDVEAAKKIGARFLATRYRPFVLPQDLGPWRQGAALLDEANGPACRVLIARIERYEAFCNPPPPQVQV